MGSGRKEGERSRPVPWQEWPVGYQGVPAGAGSWGNRMSWGRKLEEKVIVNPLEWGQRERETTAVFCYRAGGDSIWRSRGKVMIFSQLAYFLLRVALWLAGGVCWDKATSTKRGLSGEHL